MEILLLLYLIVLSFWLFNARGRLTRLEKQFEADQKMLQSMIQNQAQERSQAYQPPTPSEQPAFDGAQSEPTLIKSPTVSRPSGQIAMPKAANTMQTATDSQTTQLETPPLTSTSAATQKTESIAEMTASTASTEIADQGSYLGCTQAPINAAADADESSYSSSRHQVGEENFAD